MDKWDKFAGELNKMENLNHYSIISFWKERLQEETELFNRKIVLLNDEINRLKAMVERYAHDATQTYQRLGDTEKRFDLERTILEEKLKARESELKYERTRIEQIQKTMHMLQEVKPGSSESGIISERDALRKEINILRQAKEFERESEIRTEKTAEHPVRQNDQQTSEASSSGLEHKLRFFKKLEEAHLLDLENLARGFAHRVRNYLGIISGTAQMVISRSKLNDEDKEQIDLIEENAREMLTSIEEFLSLAKIPELSFKSVSVSELVYTICLVLEDQLKNQGIDIQKNLPENLPKVEVDEKLIGEVLNVLLSNAAESMKAGGTITAETLFDKDQQVVFI